MGHPVSVEDDDIAVDFPSDAGLSEIDAADFLDAEYMIANIKLARISRGIIASVYNHAELPTSPFSQRVQKALSDLREGG